MKEKMYRFDIAASALIGAMISWTLSKGFEITTQAPLYGFLFGLCITAILLKFVQPVRRRYEKSNVS